MNLKIFLLSWFFSRCRCPFKPIETFIERLYSFEQFSDKEDLDDAKKVYPKVKSMIQAIDKQRTKKHQINLKQLQNKFNELERKLK